MLDREGYARRVYVKGDACLTQCIFERLNLL